jgi:hypothetical protein
MLNQIVDGGVGAEWVVVGPALFALLVGAMALVLVVVALRRAQRAEDIARQVVDDINERLSAIYNASESARRAASYAEESAASSASASSRSAEAARDAVALLTGDHRLPPPNASSGG